MLSAESNEDTMREVYDFSNARRNPYAAEMREHASNLILLEPDLYEIFPDSKSVNDALRLLVEMSKALQQQQGKRAS